MPERERDGGHEWAERRNGRMSVNLVLLANSTTSNKYLTKVDRPGHQKSHSRIDLVWKTPMWPERGEEWIEWRRAEWAEGGTYICLRK